jgi:hypothetical protein
MAELRAEVLPSRRFVGKAPVELVPMIRGVLLEVVEPRCIGVDARHEPHNRLASIFVDNIDQEIADRCRRLVEIMVDGWLAIKAQNRGA